jgi:copper chaperone
LAPGCDHGARLGSWLSPAARNQIAIRLLEIPSMIEFKLPDMSCGHCAATVQRTVQRLDAQAAVQVDLATRSVQIDADVDVARLRAALTEEGYPPAD